MRTLVEEEYGEPDSDPGDEVSGLFVHALFSEMGGNPPRRARETLEIGVDSRAAASVMPQKEPGSAPETRLVKDGIKHTYYTASKQPIKDVG